MFKKHDDALPHILRYINFLRKFMKINISFLEM